MIQLRHSRLDKVGHNKMLKGGAVLGLSQIIGQVCSLGRNIIIARIVSPADFGISAIFVMVIAFLEMISNLSLDRLLVQAKDGNNVKFQKVAQFLQAIRGCMVFTILFLFAGLLANLFSIPETTLAFYVLAFVPLLNGFCHLDTKRMERDLRFWPGASVELVSQVLVLLLAWPVGQWFGDYRAMLVLLVAKTFVLMMGTHIVSERKYRWSRDKKYVKRFMSFGWPLLVNGLLLFGILQGDRFVMGAAKNIFGSSYDMVDVGLYSAALMLAMVPAIMLSKISSALFLPLLAETQDCHTDFIEKSRLLGEGLAVIASMLAGITLLAGDILLPFVYGQQYQSAGGILGWLSVVWAVRLMRILPSSVAMAKGNTTILMNTNFVRIIAVAGLFFVVANEMDIVWIAIVSLIGEIAAYYFSLILIKRYLSIPCTPFVRSSYMFVGSLVVAVTFKIFIINMRVDLHLIYVFWSILLYVFIVLFVFRKLLLNYCDMWRVARH